MSLSRFRMSAGYLRKKNNKNSAKIIANVTTVVRTRSCLTKVYSTIFFGRLLYDTGDKAKEGEDDKIDELLSLK